MQFSEYWLRTFCNPALSTQALADTLTMAGLEVEESVLAAPAFQNVVVGHILRIDKHPQADKLRVCHVDVGHTNPLQIVCGAPNAAEGIKVPCALEGALLPGEFRISATVLRGVPSAGMLCSARELGLSEDHAGLMILAADAPVGEDVRTWLQLNDHKLTVKLTPNRADCLSLLGIARELSALTGEPLSPPHTLPINPEIDTQRAITLTAPTACPRYAGRVINGLDARAPTPEWMRERLMRSGLRPISALVDVTNYVMLELGQPLHAFDQAKLQGGIEVRLAYPGETLQLLNEQTLILDPDVLVIADETGAQAMAGIMGGADSSIRLETTNVFLESAFFAPEAIAGRARRYGFVSEASHRFERGVDFELPAKAMARATELILLICGGQAGPVVMAESRSHLPERPAVPLSPERVRRLLGIDMPDDEMARLLGGLAMPPNTGTLPWQVTPPSWRFDIRIEEDLVEEIIRLHGYDRLPAREPEGLLCMSPLPEGHRDRWTVRHRMAGLGFQEVITYAFIDEGIESDLGTEMNPIRLANPIASQMNVMRSTLLPGLVCDLAYNRKRQQNRVRLFELGRIFRRGRGTEVVPGFDQPWHLAALAWGPLVPEQWGETTRSVDFFDLKGDLEALFDPLSLAWERAQAHPALHPGRAARIRFEGEEIGFIGELHPRWVQKYELGQAPVVFEITLAAAQTAMVPAFMEISRQPAVTRDIALVVESHVSCEQLLKALQEQAGPLVSRIELFDLYDGKGLEPGTRSLAFRVLMQDTERTLEEAEVEQTLSAMIENAARRCRAALRV
jgi:phenylalanyl-tRNA synthetase beta chain